MKKIFLLIFGVVFVLSFVRNAYAAQFQSSNDPNGSLTVSKTESPKDLHLVGNNITVNAPVTGDLLAAGQTILVSNSVENSLFLAGGNITEEGDVGHHLRIAGNNVTVSGHIYGDAYVAGNTVEIAKGSTIDGSLYIAGQTITIDGNVAGDVKIGASDAIISGTIGSLSGNVQTLTLDRTAVVNGNLTYSSPAEASIDSNAKVLGQTKYTHKTSTVASKFGLTYFLLLIGNILLLLGFCRYWPNASKKLIANFTESPIALFGWGLLGMIGLPILGIVLLVSSIGTPFGVAIGLVWAIALFLGVALSKLAVGSLLVKSLTKDKEIPIDWQAAVVGVIATALIALIPVLGGLTIFVLTTIGFGTIAKKLLVVEKKPTVIG